MSGCFHPLVIVKNAAMNTGVQIPSGGSAFVLLRSKFSEWTWSSHDNSVFNLLKNDSVVLHSYCTLWLPAGTAQGSQFPHMLANICHSFLYVCFENNSLTRASWRRGNPQIL